MIAMGRVGDGIHLGWHWAAILQSVALVVAAIVVCGVIYDLWWRHR